MLTSIGFKRDDQRNAENERIKRRDRALVAFTILSGARDGAIISLRLKHVDIERGMIEQDAREVRTKRAKTITTWFFPVGDLTFIVGAGGKHLVKEAFTNMFRIWAKAAGVNKSPHGIRKAAATADALDGYNDAELGAKYGWMGRQMPALYTRSANRERLSLAAAERVKARTEVPHHDSKVRDGTQEKSGYFGSLGALAGT
jgi:integrase